MPSEPDLTQPANAFTQALASLQHSSPFLQTVAAIGQAEWPAPDVRFVPLLGSADEPGVLVHSFILAERFEHFRLSLNSSYAEGQVSEGVEASLETQTAAACF